MIARLLGALRRRRVETPPEPFGYKIAWFAVKNATSQQVADALELKDARPESWKKGIEFAYGGETLERDRLFVTPPVSDWTLAVGWCAAADSPRSIARIGEQLVKFSSTFGEAQAFATHRIVEFHQWMVARKGTIERTFIFAGDSDRVVKNSGDLTRIERELGFFDKPEDEWSVDERHVMKVAGVDHRSDNP